jgi:putative transcriptional regulator
MAIIRQRLDPKNPPKLSAKTLAKLDAMTPEEIECNALIDPDNPPSTPEELERGIAGRFVRRLREKLSLSQTEFAEAFGVNVARLRDWEQGRTLPDTFAMTFLKVIEKEPKAVQRALHIKKKSAA